MSDSKVDTFNLDIDNYSINDLETFFKLKNTKYQAKDVELCETKFREKFLKNNQFDSRFIRSMIEFLEKAKNILISAKCNPPRKPTTIPKNEPLDKGEYPYIVPTQTSREGELNTRSDTQFIYTQNSDYLPGDVNPLKKRVISKFLNVDTRFRDNYYNSSSTDFTVQLPMKLNRVVSLQLSSFEIPVAFYGISSVYGNNYINMGIEYTDVSNNLKTADQIFTIPDGNYIAQDFIDAINFQLTTYTNNSDSIFSYISFNLDINLNGSGTGKVTLTTNNLYGQNAIIIKKIIMDFGKDKFGHSNSHIDLTTKIGWNLGFNKNIYDNAITYTAETLVEPATVRYIYLAIDDFNNHVNNMFISAFNKSVFSPNIIARISIKGLYFSLLMENDLNIVTEPRIYFGPVDIQRMQIRLYDDYGRIIDMNNANYSFSLIVKMLYDM